GSEVLLSLNGRELAALDWYQSGGKFRGDYNYCMLGGTPQSYVAINFGRYLWDKELAFDPSRFINPQLRIYFDIDAADASCEHNYITAFASLFDQQSISPAGFLMSKEIKSYDTGVSSHEYTDLPTDHPYRALFLRCQVDEIEPSNMIGNIKLSEDMDKRVIFDGECSLVMRGLNPYCPEVREDHWLPLAVAERSLFITATERVKAIGSVWAEEAVAQDAAFYHGDGGKLYTYATANPKNTQILTSGRLPHGTWCFPFGDPMK
ncbi:unnamed protein product, partial [marine sediment metagenome]